MLQEQQQHCHRWQQHPLPLLLLLMALLVVLLHPSSFLAAL
jgi:hypothetical protein